jgi:prophage regulatory protein
MIRMPDVKRRTGLSRALIYREIKLGKFPAPHKLGARAVGWRVGDIDGWLRDRPKAA